MIFWNIKKQSGEARSIPSALAGIESQIGMKVQAVGKLVIDAKTGEVLGKLEVVDLAAKPKEGHN